MSELEWNVRAPGQPGGIDLLRLSVRSFRGDVRQATPDDLIACLRANASACGEVMAAMGWVTDQALAVTDERAEQAERERDEARAEAQDRLQESISVANVCNGLRDEYDALERRRTREVESLAYDHAKAVAERDEARELINRDRTGLANALAGVLKLVQGWAWVGAGEWGSYDYTERTEATLRAEWSTFEEQAVTLIRRALRESGYRADHAFHPEHPDRTEELDSLRAQLTAVERERDEARALEKRSEQLRALDRAEVVMFRKERDALRSRLAKTEAVARKVAALRLGPLGHCLEHMAMLVAEARRALDEDSGGSGAATSTGASNAPEAGSTPEPAGSSRYVACRGCGQPLASDLAAQRIADGCPCNSHRGINHGLVPVHVCTCATCDPEQTGSARQRPDPQAPATRAEVEELRSRVERMENLTGCTPKE